MRKLTITTYINEELEGTIRIPLVLAKLISAPFLRRLNDEQSEAIGEALGLDDYQGVILDIEDHKKSERVVFTLE